MHGTRMVPEGTPSKARSGLLPLRKGTMLRITFIEKADMKTTRWSGGTTTELLILPRGADYASRDFLVRISTALVELESSDFTPLPDYERLIGSVEGVMRLTHRFPAGRAAAVIEPVSSVHRFDGGVPTHCEGKARDLNLMLRKGRAEGTLTFMDAGEYAMLPIAENEYVLTYDLASGTARLAEADEPDFLAFSAEGPTAVFTVRLKENAVNAQKEEL